MEHRVRELIENCPEHPAFKNKFYETWMAKPLLATQVEIFAVNFYRRSEYTPKYIALSFLQMTTLKAMVEVAENLMEEMGEGKPQRAHSVLLSRFLEELLSRLYGRELKMKDMTAPVLDSTTRLLDEGDLLFKDGSPHETCGALLAKEWHAYSQLVYLYEGARNYMNLFSLDEFHEHCEYFYLHIGATEKEHKYNSLAAAIEATNTESDFADLAKGFYGYLDLLAANWNEIYMRVQQLG